MRGRVEATRSAAGVAVRGATGVGTGVDGGGGVVVDGVEDSVVGTGGSIGVWVEDGVDMEEEAVSLSSLCCISSRTVWKKVVTSSRNPRSHILSTRASRLLSSRAISDRPVIQRINGL